MLLAAMWRSPSEESSLSKYWAYQSNHVKTSVLGRRRRVRHKEKKRREGDEVANSTLWLLDRGIYRFCDFYRSCDYTRFISFEEGDKGGMRMLAFTLPFQIFALDLEDRTFYWNNNYNYVLTFNFQSWLSDIVLSV